MIKVYKTRKDMAQDYGVHFKTIEYNIEAGKILKLEDKNGKKLGYIDIFEANLVLAQIISNINKK